MFRCNAGDVPSAIRDMLMMFKGTGGVSMFTASMASTAGCKVILTSSSDEKLRRVKQMPGLSRVLTINYKDNPDWHQEAVRLNDEVGVDIVIENGGTSSLLQSCAAVAKRGTTSQVGYLGKQDVNDLQGLLSILIDRTITLRYDLGSGYWDLG